MTQRLDKALVEKGLVTTRSKAQQLIENGKVSVDGLVVTRVSYKIIDQEISIDNEIEEVGRGYRKLEGAFEEFNINLDEKIVADVGASTGGFTQYCLSKGAKKVFAIDVGHDQLDAVLRVNSKVINIENQNIRELHELDDSVDFCVTDLSFISLRLYLKNLVDISNEGAEMLILYKPQFEVGKSGLGKKGLVKSNNFIHKAFIEVYNQCQDLNLSIIGFSPCVIKGRKTGNQEYFLYLSKKSDVIGMDLNQITSIIGE